MHCILLNKFKDLYSIKVESNTYDKNIYGDKIEEKRRTKNAVKRKWKETNHYVCMYTRWLRNLSYYTFSAADMNKLLMKPQQSEYF